MSVQLQVTKLLHINTFLRGLETKYELKCGSTVGDKPEPVLEQASTTLETPFSLLGE